MIKVLNFFLVITLIVASLIGFKYYEIIKRKEKIESEIKVDEMKRKSQKESEFLNVRMYFSSINGDKLISSDAKIKKEEYLEDTIVNVLNKLFKGPENIDLRKVITQITNGSAKSFVRTIFIKNDLVYVDLNRNIIRLHPSGTLAERLTIYSIVNTLTSLTGVSRVQFLINGHVLSTLKGHIDISMPIEFNKKIVAPI